MARPVQQLTENGDLNGQNLVSRPLNSLRLLRLMTAPALANPNPQMSIIFDTDVGGLD